jgi:hypothetical protein
MNPNWTGRAARTLSECRFTDDANPIERSAPRPYTAAWWVSLCVVSLLGLMAVVHFAQ